MKTHMDRTDEQTEMFPLSSLPITFLSSFIQARYPLLSLYWSPKYHASRRPVVRHTRSNSSCPTALWSRLNSSSASSVLIFTGNTFPGFLRRKRLILAFFKKSFSGCTFVLNMFDNDLMLLRILNHLDMFALSFLYCVFIIDIFAILAHLKVDFLTIL